MLDTISLNLEFNLVTGEYIEQEVYDIVYNSLVLGNFYEVRKEIPKENKRVLNVKLSYPRAYAATNAYLISNSQECLVVNNRFISEIEYRLTYDSNNNMRLNYNDLINWFRSNVSIRLTRVDTPFTYLMSEPNFNGYKNLYMMLNDIYTYSNSNAIPKNFGVLGSGEMESLIFTNTTNVSSYHSKIMIYNQYNKFQNYYGNSNMVLFNSILLEYPDLPNRMRIEVSKRINRKGFTTEEFRVFDIFSAYVYQNAKYALENLFNIDIFNLIYRQRIEHIKQRLISERQFPGFTYQNFVCRYINEIWDYDIIRIAIMEASNSANSGYQGTSTVKGVLDGYQQTTSIYFTELMKSFNDIRNMLIGICGGGVC